MRKMTKCKTCSKEIAPSVKKCLECGAKNSKSFYKKWWIWAIAVIIVVGVGSGEDSNNSELDNGSEQEISESEKLEDNNQINEKIEENIPTEYKSTLRKAKTYSDPMNLSKAGVYNQLTSEYGEKFSQEAAQYAIVM